MSAHGVLRFSRYVAKVLLKRVKRSRDQSEIDVYFVDCHVFLVITYIASSVISCILMQLCLRIVHILAKPFQVSVNY